MHGAPAATKGQCIACPIAATRQQKATTMAIQFTKNGTFSLRATALYDSAKQYRTEDGFTVFKVGEPSANGIPYPSGTEVLALEKFAGGGWLVRFPDGELGYVDSNKIIGNESQYQEKKALGRTTSSTSGVVAMVKQPSRTPVPSGPLTELKAAKAEREAIVAAAIANKARMARAEAAVKELARAAQELAEAMDQESEDEVSQELAG